MVFHAPHDKVMQRILLSLHIHFLNTTLIKSYHPMCKERLSPRWYQLRHQGEVQVQSDRICLKRSQTGFTGSQHTIFGRPNSLT